MINKKRAVPVGVFVVGLLVVLAAIGIVSGLWSKNLVINGTAETGDLRVDWGPNTTGVGDDLCTAFNPLWVLDMDPDTPGNQSGCPGLVFKDVGKFECRIDPNDAQILHFSIRNAYPSYEADCQYHFVNTGSIPFHVIGFVVDPGSGLTGCGPDTNADPEVVVILCDQLKIGYFDNLGDQVDPGQERAGSLKVHVQQPAAQSICAAESIVTGLPGTSPSGPAVVVNPIICEETVSYEFDVKVCVAQWNEFADYEQCTQSPQHEGPTSDRIIDADGFASPLDGLPGAQEVDTGDALHSFPNTGADPRCGLDFFDNGALGGWTFGATGDDLHCESSQCQAVDPDPAIHGATDCVVLDINGDLAVGDPVNCDLDFLLPDPIFAAPGSVCPTNVRFHDTNGNNVYDSGEDIVSDSNGNGVFD